jgi:hypothetical protein
MNLFEFSQHFLSASLRLLTSINHLFFNSQQPTAPTTTATGIGGSPFQSLAIPFHTCHLVPIVCLRRREQAGCRPYPSAGCLLASTKTSNSNKIN